MNSFFEMVLLGVLAFVPESRISTALIDTGLSTTQDNIKYLCRDSLFDLTKTTIRDNHSHGSKMFNLIIKNIDYKKNCIAIIKYCDTCTARESGVYAKIYQAVQIAKGLPHIKYINMSLNIDYDYSNEKELIESLLNKGVVFSVAAGNLSQNLDDFCDKYPACYFHQKDTFHVLGALNAQTNTKEIYSNFGSYVTNWEQVPYLGGTSSAAAIYTNKLIRGIAR